MAKKRALEKSEVQELNEHLQNLLNKQLNAHKANASPEIMEQFENLIEMATINLRDAKALQDYHQSQNKDDGESFIV